jgi:epoxyqueuosine reductase QueG
MKRNMDKQRLREGINRIAEDLGAQAMGVAPAERFAQAPLPFRPSAFLPDASSVIVVGLHFPDACVEHCGDDDLQDMNAYGIVQVDMNVMLDMLSFRIAKLLDRAGFEAVSFSTSHVWRYRPFGVIDRCFTPDFPHRHAAVAAGLGEFGWNGLVLHPEYGPRIRFNTIITNAPLEATPMYAGPALCDKCMRCVRYCSMDAFRKEVVGMDRVTIGGRTFTFPQTNKWRCAWAEHFALSLKERIPDRIDETSVLDAKRRSGVYGGEIGNCLRQCLPPDLRVDAPDRDVSVWRRAKLARREESPSRMIGKLQDLAAGRIDSLACLPVDSLPEDVDASELPGARAILVAGLNLPCDLPDLESLDHLGTVPEGLREAAAFSREEGRRQLGTFGHQVAMLLEACGYDAMPRISIPVEKLASQCGFGAFSGDGRVFRSATSGTNCLFAAIAVTAPLPEWKMPLATVANATCTRGSLEEEARALGADLFGVTPLDRLGTFAPVTALRRLYPRLTNAIVIGMHYPDGYLRPGSNAPTGALGTYSFAQYQTHRELGWMALTLCRRLAAAGQQALPHLDLCGLASKTLNVRGTPPPDTIMERGMIGLLPFAFIPDRRANALAAVAAGLGALGWNGTALTPQYGVRQRFICVLTDLEMAPDSMRDVDPGCPVCGKCVAVCPTQAIRAPEMAVYSVGGRELRIPAIDEQRCDWAQRFGLSGVSGPALLGSRTDTKPPETIALADLTAAMESRDPLQDHFASILEPCISACPRCGAGRRGKRNQARAVSWQVETRKETGK